MTLRQVESLLSCPYSTETEDLYWWTEIWYLDSTVLVGANTPANFTLRRGQFMHNRATNLVGWRVKESPGSSVILSEGIQPFNRKGLVGSVGDPYSLISIARWRVLTEGRETYKYQRMPILDKYTDGDLLTDTGWNLCQGAANNTVAEGIWRNRYGELVTGVEVDRKLHGWQLRHGTIRSLRSPFTIS